MKKAEAISILATSVRPREAKDRARYDEAVRMAIEVLKSSEIPNSSEQNAETAQADHIAKSGKKVSISYGHENDLVFREAAIEALARMMPRSYTPDGSHPGDEEIFRAQEVFADCIEALEILPSAQPEQQWIPCSERLPENEYVLISKKPTMISGDKWSVAIAVRMADPRSGKIQWRDSGFGVIQDDKVLAWMPLPEAYRGGDE